MTNTPHAICNVKEQKEREKKNIKYIETATHLKHENPKINRENFRPPNHHQFMYVRTYV